MGEVTQLTSKAIPIEPHVIAQLSSPARIRSCVNICAAAFVDIYYVKRDYQSIITSGKPASFAIAPDENRDHPCSAEINACFERLNDHDAHTRLLVLARLPMTALSPAAKLVHFCR